MYMFGMTGGIGSGKSTVATLLVNVYGVTLFDCDTRAKELLVEPIRRGQLLEILGEDVFTLNGLLNKSHLREIIYNDPKKKAALEALIHPLVWQQMMDMRACKRVGAIGVAESAIIYEIGWQNRFRGMIVAICSREEQIRRTIKRGMSIEAIERCMACQMPMEEKVQRADFVIDTECDIPELQNRVNQLYCQLKAVVEKEGA